MNEYPQTFIDESGMEFSLRLMSSEDRAAVLKMSQKLSEPDLWFMRRDLTQPEAIDAWINDIEISRAVTLLLEHNHEIAAHGSLYHNQLSWNRHIAEVRIMVTAPYRNRGLGGRIAKDLIGVAQELGFEKVFSYTSSGDKGARRMLEGVGFKPEALLADWIKTSDERTLDLVIMSAPIAELVY